LVDKVDAGTSCWVIPASTPFYVEKGGQVSDRGSLEFNGHEAALENLKRIDNAIAHKIIAPTTIKVDDIVVATVDKEHRLDVMNNHTATHLLQSALIQLLGKEVRQSGSLVDPDYLRFDFTYHKTLTPEQIKQVEDLVNRKIRENMPVKIYNTSYQEAIDKGVIAIFGEKYNPEQVRVIDIAPFSMELCGGTHVSATGDIGCFKIMEETALSAGQRRIFAVTGKKAIELFQGNFDTVKTLSQEFKVQPHEVVAAVEKQKEQLKDALGTIKKLKKESWKTQLPTWLESVEEVKGIPFGFFALADYGADELKEIAQKLADKKPGFYFMLSCQKDRCSLFSLLSDQFTTQVDLKAFSTWLKDSFGLRGGGKKGILQGGGPFVDQAAVKKGIEEWLKD